LKTANNCVSLVTDFVEQTVRRIILFSFAALTLMLVFGEAALARVGSGGPL
jgi:hypothetical protein